MVSQFTSTADVIVTSQGGLMFTEYHTPREAFDVGTAYLKSLGYKVEQTYKKYRHGLYFTVEPALYGYINQVCIHYEGRIPK